MSAAGKFPHGQVTLSRHQGVRDITHAPQRTTVCLIGCAGFIGSHLTGRLLRDTSLTVIGVDREQDRIADLLEHPRLEFHRFDVADSNRLASIVDSTDIVVNLAALCNPSLYNTQPLEVIESNFTGALPLVRQCAEQGKWLVHFSTCEVYGRTLAGFAPPGSAFRDDPRNYVLSEHSTPLVLGPVHLDRWCYSAAKQLLERLLFAEGKVHGLPYTIIRPFNFVGPRMDFLPGVDGEGIPRVVPCFMHALLSGQPLQLVDGGHNRRTFVFIDDAIDAVVRILARPDASQGQIFNVGNPDNEVTMAELATLMIEIFAAQTGRKAAAPRVVEAREFYGEGYDDCDRRVPDITLARERLGWQPRTPLRDLLTRTIVDYVQRYGPRVTAQ